MDVELVVAVEGRAAVGADLDDQVRRSVEVVFAEAGEYMPRLFGPDNYVTLANVATLPCKLPDLYRRLTVG